MITATVYFIDLTDEMVEAINDPKGSGWASPEGVAYQNAKQGKVDLTNVDLFQKVAVVTANNAEQVYEMLQNLDAPWIETPEAGAVRGRGERSMDIGDLIVWGNGRRQRVANFGFKQVE